MLRHARLIDLHPQWVAVGGKRRYGMGVSFDCPRHGATDGSGHRLVFWFENPMDGEPPAPPAIVDSELYPRRLFRLGGGLEYLTLHPVGGSDPTIDVYQHWRGYISDGQVYDAFGMGW